MQKKTVFYGGIAAASMLVIILDAKTAVMSAAEGVELCLRTLIPSLFPFFVLSGVINSCLLGQQIRLLRPLGRICKIPVGAESLLLLGFLAGYPVGAQLIAQAYREGKLSRNSAGRMLGFCNNAGPSFVFGMLTPLFASVRTVWVLWGVHILSALIIGWLLPVTSLENCRIAPGKTLTPTESIQRAMKALGMVCGWVVIFRVILGFCQRWFLWYFSDSISVVFSGLLELANGCVLLSKIPSEWMRFLLASGMLAFGGVCVGMQTISVTGGMGTGRYFPGKLLQTAVAVLLCLFLRPIIFS